MFCPAYDKPRINYNFWLITVIPQWNLIKRGGRGLFQMWLHPILKALKLLIKIVWFIHFHAASDGSMSKTLNPTSAYIGDCRAQYSPSPALKHKGYHQTPESTPENCSCMFFSFSFDLSPFCTPVLYILYNCVNCRSIRKECVDGESNLYQLPLFILQLLFDT